jgi:DNA-binding MurR/RpiR family transcriptional regulator
VRDRHSHRLSIADDLNRLRGGDLVIILAYSRVYLEVDALLHRIADVRAKSILLTDTLAELVSEI